MASFLAVATSLLGVFILVSTKNPMNRHIYASVQKKDHFLSRKDLILREKFAADVLGCLQFCLSVDFCWSVNYGLTSSTCQLLAWTEKSYRQSQLAGRRGFIFINLHTRCDDNPCQNGGSCVPTKSERNFHCNCPKHYRGTVCEKNCVIFDFEQGNLNGWTRTGNAFNSQPTYGDNPTQRGSSHPANQSGNWWVGTYEYRPSASSPPGYQGEYPIGTLTSPQFTIKGARLSFLIGGGCDIRTSRAELLVDSVVVANATGQCKDTMTEKQWDVSAYEGKTAELRLIDDSSAFWGRINFDHLVEESC